MKKIGLHEIRQEFIDFFKDKGHLVIKSFPLIPKNDKSLLLINAGMAPLKPYFTGEKTPPSKRIVTCQKCIRTADIENVGKTDRHATFFEMLGNFSFGDYFKREAIEWAWEFLTERLEIPKEDLWVSIYKEDDEAFKIWNEVIGLEKEKIVPLGKEDNFWELEIGPCGPCSEIYIDRGKKYGCGKKDCKPGCDCERFIEIWNLVFTQYDKDKNGEYHPLEHPNIDTGMGLERITAIIEGARNIFEIEEIQHILKFVEKTSGKKYGIDPSVDTSIRVITDHSRAITFMVSDGILPSNEGRGYVLRRLIRRAARHGKLLGIEEPFLNKIVDVVISSWKVEYPELEEKKVQIKKVIQAEEEKFQETIHQGINILENYIEELISKGDKCLSGKNAFKLYDTYGFPLDLTREILEEKGLTVDEKGFNQQMEKQRNMARKARKSVVDSGWKNAQSTELFSDYDTQFVGYDILEIETKVLGLFKQGEAIENLEEYDQGIIILKETPFYGESGGQVGDTGYIRGENFVARVLDTKRIDDVIVHFINVENGRVSVEEPVYAIVDKDRRENIKRNHSATHLLHRALKDILGEHVNQAGSIVLPDRLRFDFTHYEPVREEQLKEIERIVNKKILESLEVKIINTTLNESQKMGAVGLFEDKYEDEVRIVQMGDYSKELCGGTHVDNTSNIGLFKIISESSIAAGVRRIEAITGYAVYEYINQMEKDIQNISSILKTDRSQLTDRIYNLIEELKKKEKELNSLKSKMASSIAEDIINKSVKVDGVNLISYKIEDMDMDSLRNLGDEIKNTIDSGIIVLASIDKNKVSFVSMVTKDLVNKGFHAGNIIKEVAKITDGGGGGRPDMAQAGGKNINKVEEALSMIPSIIKKQIE
ncbi:alanyl-tRNA synthetase [Keratinibaculum paraultunense]|uniref:Alanine--tRNA ligase n=1 Tax=Keratinibaculum paraultunense TaxID=1278232 RepID=A0A4R3KYM2_9FIRM|nr:alanine--tRNA ligase [Keratinibaculum paraultunense]QQY80562.1 alanine--tRNA ligase [Keratinibaculum paraultunense]TCS91288.1 alanyl-tRNA synthetase [Keratinibaculum paraultunense]